MTGSRGGGGWGLGEKVYPPEVRLKGRRTDALFLIALPASTRHTDSQATSS
jgi:hypothetical protein